MLLFNDLVFVYSMGKTVRTARPSSQTSALVEFVVASNDATISEIFTFVWYVVKQDMHRLTLHVLHRSTFALVRSLLYQLQRAHFASRDDGPGMCIPWPSASRMRKAPVTGSSDCTVRRGARPVGGAPVELDNVEATDLVVRTLFVFDKSLSWLTFLFAPRRLYLSGQYFG